MSWRPNSTKTFEETLNISFLMPTKAVGAFSVKLSSKIGPQWHTVLNLRADCVLNPSGLCSQQELD